MYKYLRQKYVDMCLNTACSCATFAYVTKWYGIHCILYYMYAVLALAPGAGSHNSGLKPFMQIMQINTCILVLQIMYMSFDYR